MFKYLSPPAPNENLKKDLHDMEGRWKKELRERIDQHLNSTITECQKILYKMKVEDEKEYQALTNLVIGKMMRKYGRKADKARLNVSLIEDMEILLFNADLELQPTYSHMSGGEKDKNGLKQAEKTDVKKPTQPQKQPQKTDVEKPASSRPEETNKANTNQTETAENPSKRLRRDEEMNVKQATSNQPEKTDVKKSTASNQPEKTEVQKPTASKQPEETNVERPTQPQKQSEKTDVENTTDEEMADKNPMNQQRPSDSKDWRKANEI